MKAAKSLLPLIALLLVACSDGEQWQTSYYYYSHRGNGLTPTFYDAVIRIDQKGDSLRGWFYCNSDEFEEERVGHFPGFAVLEMLDLKIKDGRISFRTDRTGVEFLNKPYPLGCTTNAEALATDSGGFKPWSYNPLPDYINKTAGYSGHASADTITLNGIDRLDGKRLFVKVSEQEARNRISNIDMFFLADNTAGKESRTQNSHDPATKLTPEEERSAYDNMAATFYYYTYNDGRFGPENAGHPSFDDHVIRLETRGENIKGWYYGNTDDCTPPRTKGFPGFFVKPLENLTVRDGKISFTVTFADTYFLNRPSPIDYRTNIFSLEDGYTKLDMSIYDPDGEHRDEARRVWVMQESTPLARTSAVYTGTFGTDGITLDSTAATRARKRFAKITKDEAVSRMNSIDTTFVTGNTSPKEYTDEQLRTKQMIREVNYAMTE